MLGTAAWGVNEAALIVHCGLESGLLRLQLWLGVGKWGIGVLICWLSLGGRLRSVLVRVRGRWLVVWNLLGCRQMSRAGQGPGKGEGVFRETDVEFLC